MKPPRSRKSSRETSLHSSLIKAEAIRLGFDGCGISHAAFLSDEEPRLITWLKNHYHSGMYYMQNNLDKRLDPRQLVEGTRSVISVILNYFPSANQEDPRAPVISKYAYGNDYHGVIRDKLKQLLRYIDAEITPATGRAFVDSAPVLDRAWAARAGLGWIGKNTNLISPEAGSFFFIGTLLVSIPLAYDNPIKDFCGDCNRCIRACPTQAIVAPRVLDAGKCISYLTIEHRGEISTTYRDSFQNRVFGCDICQDVCPWNRRSTPHRVKEFEPLPGLLEMKREDWYTLDEPCFNTFFGKSALKRTAFSGLKRNLAFLQAETSSPQTGAMSSPDS
jgi:epoxyqueuosine reductase